MKLIGKLMLPKYDEVGAREEFTNLLMGEDAPCMVDPKKKRRDVLRKVKVGAPVQMKWKKRNGYRTILVIDPISGLDFGEVSSGTSEHVWSKYPRCKMIGEVIEKASGSARIRWKVY